MWLNNIEQIDIDYYKNNIVTWIPWDKLENFIKEISKVSFKNNINQIVCDFNWIKFIITPDYFNNPEKQNEIVNFYQNQLKNNRERYLNSPEWIKKTEENESRIIKEQNQLNMLVTKLETLNFKNNEEVLDWMCSFEKINWDYNKDNLIKIFSNNWFNIWVNTWKKFNLENSDNFAKYIVWQALEWIKSVWNPNQIIHKFTNDWKEKFWKQQKKDISKINNLLKKFKK